MKTVRKSISYQVNTTNTSFIKMHMMLKSLGIKNNKFFLKLYDKSLMDIDPFDEENLTLEQQSRIVNEIRKNFWYFIREIVRIPVPGGIKRYEIHRGNLALNYCILKNINTYIELPRQNFKTVSAACAYIWLYNFATSNSEMMLLNKKYEDSKRNLRTIKEIREKLPSYLQFITPSKDVDNLTIIQSYLTNNKIVAKPAAHDAGTADGLGRGCTQPVQWYSLCPLF